MRPSPDTAKRIVDCLAGSRLDTAESTSWPALAEIAVREGMAGLLLAAVQRDRVSLPEPARRHLREEAIRVASGISHRLRCLVPVARAFAEARVPLLLLKGAALHLTLYAQPDLRPMSDVDCMVPLDRLDEACALLDQLGCRRGPVPVGPDFFPTYVNEVEYFTPHARFPVRLDLHARPFRPLRYAQSVPANAFWTDAVVAHLRGVPLQVPGREDMLIHLTVHAAVHGAQRCLWLYDIWRFATEHADHLNWPALVERARAWGLLHPLAVGLGRAEDLFAPFLPAEARSDLRVIRPGLRDRLALWHAPRDAAHPVGHVAVNLLTTRGWRFRLRYLAAVLVPARRHLETLYPWRHPGWIVCAHAWRALRALGRGIGLGQVPGA